MGVKKYLCPKLGPKNLGFNHILGKKELYTFQTHSDFQLGRGVGGWFLLHNQIMPCKSLDNKAAPQLKG